MEEKTNPQLYALRHSLAHVLAQAVQQQFPGVSLGFGPPTDTGLYYDFDFKGQTINEKDFPAIEKRMKRIIQEKQVYTRSDHSYEEALAKVEKLGEPYKLINIKMLKERGIENFSFYRNDKFEDLCEGPHVANTGVLPSKAFKLDRIAGAYWLGDERNVMLTRIYALAFADEDELKNFLKRREIAETYDHKKLGKELGIFHFDDLVGKGLPLWLPAGTVIRDEIETYAKEMEFKAGYQRVSTPSIAKKQLYLMSKHLPAYEDSMFPPMLCKHEDTGYEEQFYLRPMNCPHHHLIFKSVQRSYRDLPLRLAEYGTTFRYEQSGELSGLLRVRGMTLNDAHLYLRLDQVEEEVRKIVDLYMAMYAAFKLKEYWFRLSLRDPDGGGGKYQGSRDMWEKAESMLMKIMDGTGLPYQKGVGEAAFYGPKIDIQFKNLMGREETVSTIQLDYLAPENFDLHYIDEAGKEQRPVVIHRAPLSTHERFVSYLLEYYGGALPTWLAPVQVVLIPVNEDCHNFCEELTSSLRERFVRAEVDLTHQSFNKKIRTHTMKKVPLLLIIGNKEVQENTVTIRRFGIKEQQTLSREVFITELLNEIRERKNFREPITSIV